MPDLHRVFQDTDLDFLNRVARFWGIDLPLTSFHDALDVLAASLNDQNLAQEVIAALPEEAQAAWQSLLHAGRIPAAQFIRRYGELRIQGEGWRKREEPDLHPASITEMLWYRGLVGKGFFGKAGDPQEFFYVPDELMAFFSQPEGLHSLLEIRPAPNEEHAIITLAGGGLIARTAVLLAELRKDPQYPRLQTETRTARDAFCVALLETAGMVLPGNQVAPEKSREILEKEPGDSLLFFFDLWLQSEKINDLRMVPGLAFEGTWSNPVETPRKLMVDILRGCNENSWWSLPSLISEVKRRSPDFQRSAGDYDSWFIRRRSDGQVLQGFDAWDQVEGLLIRYLISGPLHWLGLVDLGAPGRGKSAASFRISSLAPSLLSANTPNLKITPASAIKTTSDGFIHMPAGIQAALHYQTARFCHLEKETAQETVYSVTLDSLKGASNQGLKPTQLGSLLKRAGESDMPPGFTRLLERVEKFGVEARLDRAILITVQQPELLEALFKDPRASRFLEEMISPRVARVKPGGEDVLLKILREMGRLAEIHLDV